MTLKITRIDARGLNAEQTVAKLAGSTVPLGSFSLLSATAVVSEAGKRRTLEVFGEELTPHQVVERICQEVLATGLAAVLKYTEKLDKVKLQPEQIRVSAAELAAAHKQADPQFLTTVRKVRDNILEFQRAILHQDKEVRRPGVVLRQRYLPLDRVGCCVPGGAAAYPSTVLMTAVPAQAAGVKEIVIVAPPTPFGANNPDVLATCAELGISEVYRLGGAQAVAAMAYGLGTALPRVDKIVGPGNMFVTLAKKHVYGVVDIDSLAGPSEVVVIADDSTSAQFTAADMLAQAEHSPGSAVLVTWSEQLLDAVEAELTRQSATLSRCELTLQSLQAYGCMILVENAAQACEVTNLLAPEHLHIATANAEALLGKINHAGAMFLGPHSPVALGDYAAGPSHVLPTSGTARWASGLSANSFLRSSSVIQYNSAALAEIAPHIQRLADKEGLTAHRASVDVRLTK